MDSWNRTKVFASFFFDFFFFTLFFILLKFKIMVNGLRQSVCEFVRKLSIRTKVQRLKLDIQQRKKILTEGKINQLFKKIKLNKKSKWNQPYA
jgi:hypothetical protein